MQGTPGLCLVLKIGDDQIEIANKIDEDMSVRSTEKLVAKHLKNNLKRQRNKKACSLTNYQR